MAPHVGVRSRTVFVRGRCAFSDGVGRFCTPQRPTWTVWRVGADNAGRFCTPNGADGAVGRPGSPARQCQRQRHRRTIRFAVTSRAASEHSHATTSATSAGAATCT
jgi:hypothetical protein